MCHTVHSGHPWTLFHLEEKMKSVVKRVFAVQGYSMYCVPPSMHYMHCMSVGLGRKEES